MPEYGETGSPSDYQEDHLISLELGGNPTDPRNLWPEPYPRAADVDKIVFTVSIYEAEARQQSFGQVRNAYIRVLNAADNRELARYDLTEDASTEPSRLLDHTGRNVDRGYRANLPRQGALDTSDAATDIEHDRMRSQ